MPFLNEEVKEWIALELQSLGVEDLAVYALEAGQEGDERRVMVATEVGLLDHRYAPFGSSARYRLAMLMYPWQVLRGVELRADTFRLWAREHRTRWSFRLNHPHFEAATESPDLGQALCDLARVCAVMAEPFGVPAGRVSSDVPGVIPGGPRPIPPTGDSPEEIAEGKGEGGAEGTKASRRRLQPRSPRTRSRMRRPRPRSAPTAVPIGDDEEILELSDEEREAVPTRSDDQERRAISIASPKLKNRYPSAQRLAVGAEQPVARLEAADRHPPFRPARTPSPAAAASCGAGGSS